MTKPWLSAARKLFGSTEPKTFTWEGVYENFAGVPRKGDPFQEDFAEDTAKATAASLGTSGVIPRDGGLLALIASEIAVRNGRVSILDFGGAAGIDYIAVRTLTRQNPIELDYAVVDNPRMCELGRRVHAGDPSIRFETEIDNAIAWDIVHASASLSYVENWKALILRLIDRRPAHFLLFNTFVGEFPTFATAQMNVPGSSIPFWFFSKTEIVDLFASADYALTIDVPTGREYDHSNFPEDRRPGRARNLVFRRRS